MRGLGWALSKLLTAKASFHRAGFKRYLENSSTVEYKKEINFEDNKKTHSLPKRVLKFGYNYTVPREVWVENFDTVKEEKRGIVELHPKIFGTMPRLDIIFGNIRWQSLFRKVDKTHAKTKAECKGGGRKPWRQKGLGKARQGSIRSPQFIKGGTCHGPRNPTSHFFMIPLHYRVHGLTSALSAKFAQDDVHIVENINIPTDDPQFMLDLIDERAWGNSVLIIDKEDIMPRNIIAATRTIEHVNLMPVYGLNVYSMLKHETLVLTLDAVDEIEDRLLTVLNYARERELRKKRYKEFGIKFS